VFILKKKSPPEPGGQILITLGKNHPRVKGIINCSKKGSGPFQRVDNHKNAKMGWCHFKIFFSRSTEPE
jgi:hypothetical protein